MSFRVNPEVVVDALCELVDAKGGRMTVEEATAAVVTKLAESGHDLGKHPEVVVRAVVALADPSLLNLKPGPKGGIGRPSMSKPSQKKGHGLVAMVRDALASGASVEEIKKRLEDLSPTEATGTEG
jgi:hypothetical protein